jgi:hypothetical protein
MAETMQRSEGHELSAEAASAAASAAVGEAAASESTAAVEWAACEAAASSGEGLTSPAARNWRMATDLPEAVPPRTTPRRQCEGSARIHASAAPPLTSMSCASGAAGAAADADVSGAVAEAVGWRARVEKGPARGLAAVSVPWVVVIDVSGVGAAPAEGHDAHHANCADGEATAGAHAGAVGGTGDGAGGGAVGAVGGAVGAVGGAGGAVGAAGDVPARACDGAGGSTSSGACSGLCGGVAAVAPTLKKSAGETAPFQVRSNRQWRAASSQQRRATASSQQRRAMASSQQRRAAASSQQRRVAASARLSRGTVLDGRGRSRSCALHR